VVSFFFAAPVPTGDGWDPAGAPPPAPVDGAVPPVAAPTGWDPAAQPAAQGWD
jgi:small subunit ribosomal protein SAe